MENHVAYSKLILLKVSSLLFLFYISDIMVVPSQHSQSERLTGINIGTLDCTDTDQSVALIEEAIEIEALQSVTTDVTHCM